jgi:hypothetical protein
MERMENIITLLKENRYCFKPVRRVYIPKSNGKTRPLGMPMPCAYCISSPSGLGSVRAAQRACARSIRSRRLRGLSRPGMVDTLVPSHLIDVFSSCLPPAGSSVLCDARLGADRVPIGGDYSGL